MIKYLLGLCLVAVTNPTIFAADATDAKAIEGAWMPIQAELAGRPLPAAVLNTISLKMTGGRYEVTAERADYGTYTLDATTQPKGMTVTGTNGPNQGKTFPCIYELHGDTLRICYDLSGKQQPTEFKSAPGTKLYLVTYNRLRRR